VFYVVVAQETNIWGRIEQYKQIFIEPKSKGVLNDVCTVTFFMQIFGPLSNGKEWYFFSIQVENSRS